MPYGYLGQNTPNQTVSNSGVFSISDVASLEKQGKFGGSLELIDSQSVTSAFCDFTNLPSNYDVLMFQIKQMKVTTQTNVRLRISNDNGSNYIASGYQYALQRGYPATFTELKSTSAGEILLGGDVGTNAVDNFNAYVYMYNANNSSKYTFFSLQSIWGLASASIYSLFTFGGGVLPTAEIHNAVRFGQGGFSALSGAEIKLYGVKQL